MHLITYEYGIPGIVPSEFTLYHKHVAPLTIYVRTCREQYSQ